MMFFFFDSFWLALRYVRVTVLQAFSLTGLQISFC